MLDFEQKMERRDFIKFVSVLLSTLILPNCADSQEAKRLLENEDRPGFYVRFIKPIKPLDSGKWALKVGGLCSAGREFTLADLKQLAKTAQVSRMKCVESWSAKAKWGGFLPRTLFDVVKPKENAKYLYFHCADDYYEYIPLTELLKPRVLFAYEMNDAPLPDVHGAPLRLIIPSKYGYKSIKTILRLEFLAKAEQGYWIKSGYSDEATIQPGTDYALDLKTYKIIEKPGEPDY
jgi:DMSO/TMAO reductase YedYZ molybdopterin-dependent catalytic subunit